MKEDIEEGAYVLLTVKYGLIRLISTKADLCEQIGEVDLECPVKKGRLQISKSVELPAEIPPVGYPRCSLRPYLTIYRASTRCLLMSIPPMMSRSLV